MSTRTRHLVGLMAAAGAGALVTLAALPAAAAGSHLSVTRASDGSQVTDAVTRTDVLQVRAQLPAQTGSTQLVVSPPAGGGHVVAQGSASQFSSATLAFDFSTDCFTYDPKRAPCSGRSPAPNGTWTLQLTGGLSETRQLVLRIPPAKVTGLSGSAQGTTVTLHWTPGAEPDLRGYQVLDGAGNVVVTGIAPADACTSDGCQAAFDVGKNATGQRTFAVRSQRAVCPSCSDTLPAPASDPVTVTVGSPSSSTPTSGGSTGGSSQGTVSYSGGQSSSGSTAGGAGGATSGGGTAAPQGSTTSGHQTSPARATTTQRARPSGNLDSTFNRFVPPPAAAAAPDVPAVQMAPMPEGTYKPELAYGDQTVGGYVKVRDAGGGSLQAVVEGVVSSGSLWRSVAGALVMVLAAAHLWAWLARTRLD